MWAEGSDKAKKIVPMEFEERSGLLPDAFEGPHDLRWSSRKKAAGQTETPTTERKERARERESERERERERQSEKKRDMPGEEQDFVRVGGRWTKEGHAAMQVSMRRKRRAVAQCVGE